MRKQPTHKQLVKSIKNLIESHGGFIYKHYIGIEARDLKTVADALDIPMLV